MKTAFEEKKPECIKARLKKDHRRSFFAGCFYWLGSLLLLVLTMFPFVADLKGFEFDVLENGEVQAGIWIMSFIKAFSGGIGAPLIIAVLYVVMILMTFVNFVRCTLKLFRINKKNPTRKRGYNRSGRAARITSRAYSGSFFATMAFSVLAILFGDGQFTLFFYIMFGVGALFHFMGNFIICKLSYFLESDDRFFPIERKRLLGRGLPLFRNFLQFVAIGGLVVMVDKLGLVPNLFNLISGKAGSDLFVDTLLPIVLVLITFFTVIMLRHATNVTEYNEFGSYGKGMKTVRVCSVFNLILGIAAIVVCYVLAKDAEINGIYAIAIAAISLVLYILERLLAAVSKKKALKLGVVTAEMLGMDKSLEEQLEEQLAEDVVTETVVEEEEPVIEEVEEEVEEVKEETEEERALREYQESLKNKWMALADIDPEAEEDYTDVEKVLPCPKCGRALVFKFGATENTCVGCGTEYVLCKKADGEAYELLKKDEEE